MIHVSLIRGINVGGNRKISMARLRAAHVAAGLESPQTVLQSGNVVFAADEAERGALEARIARRLADEMAAEVAVMVRTADELRAVLGANPLAAEAAADPSHLLVMFLKTEIGGDAEAKLGALPAAGEIIRPGNGALYLYYPPPAGIGRSKLTGAVIEKALGTLGTARNWNTLAKIVTLAEALEAGTARAR